jgi:Tfp pilus assembly protein PilN
VKTLTTTTLASLPRVNLLPPEIHERRKLQQVQMGLAVAVLISVAGVGLIYVNGKGGVTSAQTQYAAAQSQQTTLNQKIQALQYVTQTQAAVGSAEAALTQATASEIHWSDYLADMTVLVPRGVWITQLSLAETVSPGSLASPADAPAVVGSVQVAGTAMSPGGGSAAHNGVASWLDSVVKEKGFVSPWVSMSQEQYIGSQHHGDLRRADEALRAAGSVLR